MIFSFRGKRPRIHPTAFVHPASTIIGDVTIGAHSSVWPGAVIRADMAGVKIGKYTCIQDNAVIHVGDEYKGKSTVYLPTKIGNYVVVGHNALVHGCVVEDNCLIGAGSVVSNGTKICKCSLVGMGAVVLKHQRVQPNSVVVGIPARFLRLASDEEVEHIRMQAENYTKLAKQYKEKLKLVTE